MEFPTSIVGPVNQLGWEGRDKDSAWNLPLRCRQWTLCSPSLRLRVENAELGVAGQMILFSQSGTEPRTTDIGSVMCSELWDIWSSAVESVALSEFQLWEGGKLCWEVSEKINDGWKDRRRRSLFFGGWSLETRSLIYKQLSWMYLLEGSLSDNVWKIRLYCRLDLTCVRGLNWMFGLIYLMALLF